MKTNRKTGISDFLNMTVVISALGYFVDIYDLILFSIVRVSSLKSLGVPDADLLSMGVRLINSQMAGMLVGGVLWGIIGDKKGRVSVLFGSIFLYSVANIANAFITTVDQYAVLRFIAGIGLAGELGAAITLVAEVMPKETRGYGTAIVASVGICGAVLAAWVGEHYAWTTAYIIGGVLGLLLLVARMKMFDSGLFENVVKKAHVKRGDIFMLFNNRKRFFKYLACILTGTPIWFVIGILVTFTPEIARELGATGPVIAGKSVMYCYIGLAVGDLVSGFASNWVRSRRKILALFIALTAFFTGITTQSRDFSPEYYYFLCVCLGFATGYWAVFVTVASEHFGTNLRATVTTTVPNFVRGSVVLITSAFLMLKASMSLSQSAMLVGGVCLVFAILAVVSLPETYGKDLDYLEGLS